jgi:hypothetical protein
MSDHTQVKMTEMNYGKDRPKAENPVKVEDSVSSRWSSVAVCHPRPHRRHDPGSRAYG